MEDSIAGFPALRAPGKGRTLLFLHGAFGDHTAFRFLLENLAGRGFAGIAFARRGRLGVPPARAEGVTIADYLDDVRRVLEVLPEKPVLVGHSLGGLLAQHLAAEGRCSAAVLICPAPPGMLTAQPRTLPWLAPSLPRILAGRPFRPSDAIFRRLVLSRLAPADQDRVLASLTPESGSVYRAMMLGAARPPGPPRCPSLVVGGGDDWIISRTLLARTARFCAAPLQVHEGMGHWLLEEPGWERVADGIAAWLSSTEAA